jgi:glycosyltransferase involved in cell wall biosynthesis
VTTVSIDVSAIPAALTGAGRYVSELVIALGDRDDIGVTLVTRRADRDRWAGPAQRVAAAPRARPLRLLWEQAALPRLLDRLGVDVHHAPHYTMPERARVPSVVTVHDMTFFDHPEWHERGKVPVFRRAITRAARRAAAIVCVSETTASRFRERFPDAPPVHVAPHGVDHQRFSPVAGAVPDADALAALDVQGRYVAFVGTVEPRKDVGGLIAAFDLLAADDPDLSLVIAGRRGWGDDGVDAALAAARHRDRVRRLGYVDIDAVPALLRNAAAVAYPSRDEGFGLPVLEAMACGAPVVTTAGTVMEEVAGDAATLVRAGDATALAAGLKAVIAGGPHVDAARQRGLARAAEFTWSRSAARHAAAYHSVG